MKFTNNIGAVEENLDGSFSVWIKLNYPIIFNETPMGGEPVEYMVTALKMRSPKVTDNIDYSGLEKSDAKIRDAVFKLIYDYECTPQKVGRPIEEILKDVMLFDLKNLIMAFWLMMTEINKHSHDATIKIEYNAVSMPTHAWIRIPKPSLVYKNQQGETETINKIVIRMPKAVEVQDDEDNPNKLESSFKFVWSLVREGETANGQILPGNVIRQIVNWKNISMTDAYSIMEAHNQLSEAGSQFQQES